MTRTHNLMPRPKSATDTTATAAPTKPALPKGWQWVRFGDVVQNVNATCSNPKEAGLERYVGLEHLEPRDLRIRSWGNIADGTTFNRVFRKGQVLFGKRRAYQRKAAVAHFDGICSGDIYVFAANEKRLIPELLPFLVQTEGFATHAESTSEGSLSPRTKWKYLAEYEFALPGDPAEQRRIAELLRAADDAVEAWRDAIEEIASLMPSLSDCSASTNAQRITLEDLSARPITYGVVQPGDHDPDGIPCVRVVDLAADELDLSGMQRISRNLHEEYSRSSISEGDVLFCLRGEIGRTYIVDKRLDGANISRGVARISPRKGISPKLVCAALSSATTRREVVAAVQGSTLKEIRLGALRNIGVWLPASVEDRSAMLQTLTAAETARAHALAHIAMTRDMKSHLLANLLTPPSETP